MAKPDSISAPYNGPKSSNPLIPSWCKDEACAHKFVSSPDVDGRYCVFCHRAPDCMCADPENCTEAVPGYVCKAGKSCSQPDAFSEHGKPPA